MKKNINPPTEEHNMRSAAITTATIINVLQELNMSIPVLVAVADWAKVLAIVFTADVNPVLLAKQLATAA